MKIQITMTIEIADDNGYFVDKFPAEDNVAQYIEAEIDGSLGLNVIECDGREIQD